jgi:hypothetical protein
MAVGNRPGALNEFRLHRTGQIEHNQWQLNYYTSQDKEYYLTADEIFFIRPGLKLQILSVSIPSDLQPEVTFMLSDPGGLPLDRNGITTPGPVSTSFILAYIPQGEDAYVSYTTRVQTSPITNNSFEQASTDSGGTYTDLGGGQYLYKFATTLPADYDADATHTLGIYARRDLQEFDLDRYVDNELEHFVPSGASAPVARDIVTTETCNGRCHDPLALHGGARTDIGLCVLCHNPSQGVDPDTGNSVDFPVLIHKIHRGADLANGYTIVGYRQSTHDYSEVEFPAEINDCEICHTGGTPTEDFPLVASPSPVPVCDYSGRGITELSWDYMKAFEVRLNSATGPLFAAQAGAGSKATGKWVTDSTTFYLVDKLTGNTVQKLTPNTSVFGCVGDTAPGTFRGTAGAQHTEWLSHPSRAACGACHDDVNFETGENHVGGAYEDDSFCTICHVPDSGKEYDRSIRGAHTVEYKSKQLPGLLVNILDVTNTAPGANPTVKFMVGTKSRHLDPAGLNRLRFAIAGPNEDFSFYAQETVGSNAVRVGETNMWTYTFNTPLPADASGSYTVGFEGRADAEITGNDNALVETEDQAQDGVFAFAVTDAAAMPRRKVVDDYNCEACHSNLSLHGDNRNNPQYCVTCHRPDADDAVVRPAAAGAPESIHFKWMIHKIHSGAELENGYFVYGYQGSTHDYGHVEFSGDLRNCEKCHVNDSYEIPLPDGVLPTITQRALWTPTEPIAAACQGCHDDDTTAAHIDANTTFFGESCSTCHGSGKDFAVEKVHAR